MKNQTFFQSGIILINKPAGVSSNNVVNTVKYSLGAKKCGHLGTLDMEAEGLLPVTVNSATKLFDFFLQKDKTYIAVFRFGIETDTLDASGKILKTDSKIVDFENLNVAAKQMIGKQSQLPPVFSAKKVNGKVAYKEARKGKEIQLSPKEIEIFDFQILDKIADNEFKVLISCSSGTYIRSIARDLAEKLGTYGIMQSLTRIRCGGFLLENANTIEEVQKGEFNLIACNELFDYEKIYLDEAQSQKLLNGQEISIDANDEVYSIFESDKFLGLGKIYENKLKLTLRLL